VPRQSAGNPKWHVQRTIRCAEPTSDPLAGGLSREGARRHIPALQRPAVPLESR